MIDIKLINENTDLSKIVKLNWDAYLKEIPLQVYRVEGYYHSIGGKWGNNDYWCCKRDENPTHKTLMEFAGNTCDWGISIEEVNYHKFKYNEHEILCTNKVKILRNSKEFYSFTVNGFDYGLSKARVLLTEIQEHPIQFGSIDYQNEIINRKIMFNNMPCIIESYTIGSDRVIIKPDLECMTMEEWKNNLDEYFEGEESIPEDLFAGSIYWFRK
jgi:hypothetical protein